MAIQKNTPVALGIVAPNVYYVIGRVTILPLEGTAVVVPFGFQNQSDWETVKTIRALKVKQGSEQAAWRLRRTAWEGAHSPDESFAEPEPFEKIPDMPLFIEGAPVAVPEGDYLQLESTLKTQSVNLWQLLYGTLKNPAFSAEFVGAQDV